MDRLPVDIIDAVLDKLDDIRDVISAGQICKAWRAATWNERYWINLCREVYKCNERKDRLKIQDYRQYYFDQLEINHKVSELIESIVNGPRESRYYRVLEINELGPRARHQLTKISQNNNALSFNHAYYALEIIRGMGLRRPLRQLFSASEDQDFDCLTILAAFDNFYVLDNLEQYYEEVAEERIEHLTKILEYDVKSNNIGELSFIDKVKCISTSVRAILDHKNQYWNLIEKYEERSDESEEKEYDLEPTKTSIQRLMDRPHIPLSLSTLDFHSRSDYEAREERIKGPFTLQMPITRRRTLYRAIIYQHVAKSIGLNIQIVRIRNNTYCRIDDSELEGGFLLVDIKKAAYLCPPGTFLTKKEIIQRNGDLNDDDFKPLTNAQIIRYYFRPLLNLDRFEIDFLKQDKLEALASCRLAKALLPFLFPLGVDQDLNNSEAKRILTNYPFAVDVFNYFSSRFDEINVGYMNDIFLQTSEELLQGIQIA